MIVLKKQVYEVDSDGFLIEIYVADVDGDGNIQDEDKKNCISVDPPHGLYKPKWSGSEWIEGATQEEIDELTKQQPVLPSQTEILEQRLSDVEVMLVEILFR